MLKPATIAAVLVSLTTISFTGDLVAQELNDRRRQAKDEVSYLFNRGFKINAELVSVDGPDDFKWFKNRSIVGCPDSAAIEAMPKKSLSFNSGRSTTWAGDLDGLNVDVRNERNVQGIGFAIPSNSTARLPEANGAPAFQFEFNASADPGRAVVDLAGERAGQCLQGLPEGSYSNEELARLCPYTPPTRAEIGQTCILVTSGEIGDPLPDGSGYEAKVTDATLCNFVDLGWGESNGFTTCYAHSYKGIAELSERSGEVSAASKMVVGAKKLAGQRCAKLMRQARANGASRQKVARQKLIGRRMNSCLNQAFAELMR
jgi:hypothetical protein